MYTGKVQHSVTPKEIYCPHTGEKGFRVGQCAAFTDFRNETSVRRLAGTSLTPYPHLPTVTLLKKFNMRILPSKSSSSPKMGLLSFLRRNKPKKLSRQQVEGAWEEWAQHVTTGTLAVHL
jgi:hypothetical protein